MMKRVAAAVMALVASFTFAMPIASTPVAAQASSTTSTTATSTTATSTTATSTTLPVIENDQLGRSLPKPNSGQKPQGFGDRGGAGQLIIFGLVTAFLAAIVLRVALATRKRTNSQKLP
jgi:hypothetical protein